jgi:hypothetical protein
VTQRFKTGLSAPCGHQNLRRLAAPPKAVAEIAVGAHCRASEPDIDPVQIGNEIAKHEKRHQPRGHLAHCVDLISLGVTIWMPTICIPLDEIPISMVNIVLT